MICPNLYIQAKLTKSNVAGWGDENMKVEDVEALAETVDYDTTARTQVSRVTNDGAKRQLDDWYNRLCFASSSWKVWEREEEDCGDIFEFGGRVAGQVVRLV